MEYLYAFLIAVGFNLVMFVPAYIFKTDKLTDLSYSLSFIAVGAILYLHSEQTALEAMLLLMVMLWAMRLGTYLFVRIRTTGRDSRFDEMRSHFFPFLKFWILQGMSVWLILLPAIAFFIGPTETITYYTLAGVFIWLVGLCVETIADYQQYSFITRQESKGKWIEHGLWRYSRHPNYFGEMLVWIGIFVFTLPALAGWEIIAGAFSPLYIIILLLYVSGVPILERAAEKRWGTDPAYRAYKARTSTVILWPPKK